MKKIFISFGLIILGLFFALPVKAVCPVCTIAVGAGVGLCRWLGIDDTISGVWIGGLIVSLIFWTLDWLNKKNIVFRYRGVVTTILYYIIVVVPLYFMGIMGHPFNKLWGLDKLLFGIIGGSVVFLLAVRLNDWLKKINGGRVYFPFQKVVVPIVSLLILSRIFYFIIKCY
jgi:hypothetical protein